MKMNTSVLAAMMMAFALSACGDKAADPAPAASEAAAPAASEAVTASEPVTASEAASAPVEPASVPAEAATPSDASAALDATCQAYFERMEACLAKVDQNVAASFATQSEELKKTLAEAPAEQQAAVCKQANDAFAESVKALNCE